jgi:hypothetical protein
MTHETHVAAVPAGTEGGTAGKFPLDPQGGISASAAPADGWLPIATAPMGGFGNRLPRLPLNNPN